jgi:uncharacterized protein YprB with RNaseH-like and TPR domain
MRDLASRLRAVVSNNPPNRLHYVQEGAERSFDVTAVAQGLGGTIHEVSGSACVVIDRAVPLDASYGRRRLETYGIEADLPIRLFDPRLSPDDAWASRVVFFDVETTGLSGGAGTLAFLAGCGWFEPEAFIVRQFFLCGPAGEHALLDALTGIFARASLLVTFNGRTFDVPVMDTRWAFHRRDSPTGSLPHFDMLPPARRLWSRPAPRRGSDEARREGDSCTLAALERSVLGHHRVSDVPGMEIPSRYFRFLRTGRVGEIGGVLDHNRQDIVSLAALTAQALRLAAAGPDACRHASEQLGLGRLYERAGEAARAIRAFEMAAASDESELRSHALARLAVLLRREARHEESVAAWRAVFEAGRGRALTTLERRAAEALAIHHEHRARDLPAARDYAGCLTSSATGRAAADAAHRLRRLDRKLAAGPLLDRT